MSILLTVVEIWAANSSTLALWPVIIWIKQFTEFTWVESTELDYTKHNIMIEKWH